MADEEALFSPLAALATLRPTPSPTDRSSPFFLEEATSSSSRPPMPPFRFLSGGKKKKGAGEKKGKKGGDEPVAVGKSFRGRWFLPSLSLARVLIDSISRWCSRIGFKIHLVYSYSSGRRKLYEFVREKRNWEGGRFLEAFFFLLDNLLSLLLF